MAILAADMVGYSRLVELDETGTLARLKTHRIELIDPSIAKNNGRIVKTTGDGMLIEFASAADAVECAVEIQRRMARRNADVEPERQIRFRIGINLGDIIVEDDDVLGDGVNIAARLQTIADAGGISVSQAVRDELAHKLDIRFEDMGEQALKNISRPLRMFRVALDNVDVAPPPAPPPSVADGGHSSIAVLPFANMSGDPEQEFFADGLTEDIITALSRFRDLLVKLYHVVDSFRLGVRGARGGDSSGDRLICSVIVTSEPGQREPSRRGADTGLPVRCGYPATTTPRS